MQEKYHHRQRVAVEVPVFWVAEASKWSKIAKLPEPTGDILTLTHASLALQLVLPVLSEDPLSFHWLVSSHIV